METKDKITVGLSGAAILISVVALCISYRQSLFVKQQVTYVGEQVGYAKEQVGLVKRQVGLVEKQMGYLEKQAKGNYASLRPLLTSGGIAAEVDRDSYRITIIIKNSGHSPAVVERIAVILVFQDKPIGAIEGDTGGIIEPGEGRQYVFTRKRKVMFGDAMTMDTYTLIKDRVPINIRYKPYYPELGDATFDESISISRFSWTDRSLVGIK